MKVFSVGPDTYDPDGYSFIPEGTEWIIYHYTHGGYDGSGTAYAKAGEKFYHKSLGHCSCYGPWEAGSMADWDEVTFPELRDMYLSGTDDESVRVRACLRQLMPM